MPGQFIDDAEPQFIDDAEGVPTPQHGNSSMDAGVGSNKPFVEPSTTDKLKAALVKRANLLKGYTPLGPAGYAGMAYRAVTGEVPKYLPEPTAEGALKGLSNVATGTARLGAETGKAVSGALGITPLEKMYAAQADLAKRGAQGANRIYSEQAQPSVTGEMIGESVPGMLTGGPVGASRSLLTRMGVGAGEAALGAMSSNPQADAETSPEYWEKQKELVGPSTLLGAALPAATAALNPLSRLLKGGKPDVSAANFPAELKSSMGGEEASDVLQADLRRSHGADLAEASKPFEELRGRDNLLAPAKTPDVQLYGNQTSYQGKRMGNLLGPNDEVIIAKNSKGEDVGYLWITKEDGGYSVRKVEVDPKYQHQGIATYMDSEAQNAFGEYRGATDYTPAGKGFRESREAGKISGELPLPGYTQALDDMEGIASKTGSKADEETINLIKKYREGIQNPEANKGWNRALDVSRDINDDIEKAFRAGDNTKGEQLKVIKKALEKDLYAHPEYMEAKSLWKEKMAPWEGKEEGGTFLKRAMESPTPDMMMKEIGNASPDKALIYYNRLSDKGRNAVKSAMLEDVLTKAEGDPLAIAKALSGAKRSGAYGVFFQGQDRARLDGLEKLAKYAHRSGSTLSSIAGLSVAAGTGLSHPLIGAYVGRKLAGGPASKGMQNLYKTDAMQRLMLDAGKLSDGNPALGEILSKLSRLSGSTDSANKLKALMGQPQE
jgi:ribosomal protein S18 acetylase RimI-like enzyme